MMLSRHPRFADGGFFFGFCSGYYLFQLTIFVQMIFCVAHKYDTGVNFAH